MCQVVQHNKNECFGKARSSNGIYNGCTMIKKAVAFAFTLYVASLLGLGPMNVAVSRESEAIQRSPACCHQREIPLTTPLKVGQPTFSILNGVG